MIGNRQGRLGFVRCRQASGRVIAAVLLAVTASAGCAHRPGGLGSGGSEEEYYVADTESREQAGSPRRAEPAAPTKARHRPPPVLVRHVPTCDGPIDCHAAGLVVFQGAERLRSCYEAAGGESVGRGVVYVLLDVLPEGAVDGVLVGYSEVRSMGFMGCLEQELEALTMPAAPARSVVQALLAFGARDRAEGRAMMAAYRTAREASAGDEAVPLTHVGQAVQGCYEREFRGRATEGGRLVLTLTVGEGGRVSSVDVTEDTLGGELDECIADVVGKLTLVPDEGTGPTVVYPVVVHAGAAAGSSEPSASAPPTE